MKSNDKEYFLIFDTNVLYQTYNQRADFTTFSFNRTYENVIGIINQFDIYERVTIAIPNVVWREMKKQIVDAHNRKLEEQKKHVLKWIFPEYSINENNFSDYATYINEKVDEYKRGLSSDINKVIELQLPTNGRFQRIVERAFKKEAPFGGKDKNSDKGFKDVLLWESILEFVQLHPTASVIFYTKDNGFKEKLEMEFKELNPNAVITICHDEEEVKKQLAVWAKEIDEYAYIPNEDRYSLSNWMKSEDFREQLKKYPYDFKQDNDLMKLSNVLILYIGDIFESEYNTEGEHFFVEAIIRMIYSLVNGSSITEDIWVTIEVDSPTEGVYFIENIFEDEEVQFEDIDSNLDEV